MPNVSPSLRCKSFEILLIIDRIDWFKENRKKPVNYVKIDMVYALPTICVSKKNEYSKRNETENIILDN